MYCTTTESKTSKSNQGKRIKNICVMLIKIFTHLINKKKRV